MGNLVGLNFESFVTDQINARQSTHRAASTDNYTPNQLLYLNNNAAFLKIISCVDITDPQVLKNTGLSTLFDGNELAKKYILWGGVSKSTTSDNINGLRYGIEGYNKNNDKFAYGIGKESGLGLVPMPGVEDFSMKSLNRGSIKEASIKIKAYNRAQFEIISLLYLRLGFNIFIEWGNNLILDDDNGNYSMNNYTLEETILGGNKDVSGILDKIKEKRKGSKGNYDAILGKVKNFTWELTTSGHYVISISVISIGDVIESLSVKTEFFENTNSNLLSKINLDIGENTKDRIDKFKEEQQEENKEKYKKGEEVSTETVEDSEVVFVERFANDISFYLFLISVGKIFTSGISDDDIALALFGLEEVLVEGAVRYSPPNDSIPVLESIWDILNPQGIPCGTREDQNLCFINFEGGDNIFGYYIRLGWLLQYIEENILMSSINNGKASPYVKLDYDIKTNICYSVKSQISADPRVCIIGSKEVKMDGDDKKLYPGLAEYYVEGNGDVEYGQIMNIYVSFVWISKKLKDLTITNEESGDNTVPILDFLKQMMAEIQASTGDINQFDVVYDSDVNTIKIIDTASIPNLQIIAQNLGLPSPPDPAVFKIFGVTNQLGSFVKSFSFKTEISNNMATDIAIGAGGGSVGNNNVGGLSNLNAGLKNRIVESVSLPPNLVDTSKPSSNTTKSIEEKYQSQLKTYSAFLDSQVDTRDPGLWSAFINIFSDDQTEWDPKLFDSCKPILKNILSYQIQQKVNETNDANEALYGKVSPTQGFIPLNATFEFNGLSGIKIYEKFKLEEGILPDNYQNAVDYLIKGISHKIGTDNKWITSIETLTVPAASTTTGVEKTGLVSVSKPKTFAKTVLPTLEKPSETTLAPFAGGVGTYDPSTQLGSTYPSGIPFKLKLIDRGNTKIQRVFIHHTAGWDDRKQVIAGWENRVTSGEKGRISTEYIIGMRNPDKSGQNYDGLWEQLYDGTKYTAWSNSTGNARSKAEVGIELNALGWLTKQSDGSFKQGTIRKDSNTNKPFILNDNVGEPHMINSSGNIVKAASWQKQNYFHKYTNEQIKALETVLLRISTYPNFEGTYKFGYEEFAEVFPQNANASLTTAYKNNPNQMFCHSATTNKTDVYPQKELLEMLVGLESKRLGKTTSVVTPTLVSQLEPNFAKFMNEMLSHSKNAEVTLELNNIFVNLKNWFKRIYPDNDNGNSGLESDLKWVNITDAKIVPENTDIYTPLFVWLVFNDEGDNNKINGTPIKMSDGTAIRLFGDNYDSSSADKLELVANNYWTKFGNKDRDFDANA